MRIEANRCPYPEKRNTSVLTLLVQSPNSDAEQIRQFLNREGLLPGSELLDESHSGKYLRYGLTLTGDCVQIVQDAQLVKIAIVDLQRDSEG